MGITRAGRRTVAAAAAACGVAVVALVGACGSATNQAGGGASPSVTPGGPAPSVSPRSTPPSSSPAPAGSAPATTQCATPDLTARVAQAAGGAAAGSNYVAIDFTNVSAHSCVMFGFPGVSWVTGMRGSQIGAASARITNFPSVTATLAPSGVAHAYLQIADAGNFPAASCKPVTAHWLRIYPPDQFSSLYAKFTSQVCSGKITGGSSPLSVLPVRAGHAVSGHVP